MTRKVGPTENELHVSVANLLDLVLLPPAVYSTFPSGWGKLGGRMAQLLRRSGLKPGMPDIMIFPGNGRCFGIELKAGKNGLTDDQRDMHTKLKAAGIHAYTCRSIEAVWDVLHLEHVQTRPLRGDDRWSRDTRRLPLGETSARRGDGGEAGGSDGTQRTQTT